MTKAYWMTRYFFSSNGVIGKVNLESTIYIQLTACVCVCVCVCVRVRVHGTEGDAAFAARP